MAYAFDPEIAAALAARAPQSAPVPPTARGDWKALREAIAIIVAPLMATRTLMPDVEIALFSTKTKDGAEIELRWYTKKGAPKGPAVLYTHGGGMIFGSAAFSDPRVSQQVSATGVPFLSVDYRLAPEATGTMLVEDAYAGLTWLIANAAKLGVDTNRIAVMGESAGGGIAAGLAILARERRIPIAKQILVYPMIDDRNVTPDPALAPFANWTYDNNYTGWKAVLGDDIGTDRVSPIVAPARLKDFAGLPPAYIEVGELDIFRDEDIAYALEISKAGIPIELHVHPGAPHGFEGHAPNSQVAKRAMADRYRVLGSF
jgi:acetyl esterase/lipase